MTKKSFIILMSIFMASTSFGAIPKNKLRQPSSVLLGEGSMKGGQAGSGFTLLNLKTQVAASKRLERLTIDVGNSAAQRLNGPVAYFNVQNDPRNKKIIIDFSQTLNSRFENMHLKKTFLKSPFVKNAEIIFEPQSQTMSMVLTMKKAAAIRAKPLSGNNKTTAKLVLDIFEPNLIKGKSLPKKSVKTKR